MPALGADMEEGTVIEWLVGPGDHVAKGDIVAVVKTDKADIEIEVFESGTVEALLVPVGEIVAVGTPIATIDGDAGASAVQPSGIAPAPNPRSRPEAPKQETTRPAAPAPRPSSSPVVIEVRPRISPYARRLASELGVDVSAIAEAAAAPVQAADIRAASTRAARPVEPADQATAMRHAIANLMARSKREIPHYYLRQQVDASRALAWLSARNADEPVERRALPGVLLCKATALAVRSYPELNGFWVDDAFQAASGVHLGVAIALRGGGLIAPAIHDADQLSIAELMAAVRDLTVRARSGRLRATEMSDPTITVTNLGDQGVDAVFGVIYPPQVALVGFGQISERPWAEDGKVVVRPVVEMTLAADHRATDGHVGARFLAAIERLLHHPEDL
jgi:pyruvate dehydrogenase E2 component (dihydrolipoamide acetyltransferase)